MQAGRAGRGTRAGGALAHLLLVVVLALGVFVMHAVGHPEGSSGAEGTTSHSSAPRESAPHHETGSPDSSPHGSGMGAGMDMTTLCVAVLGGWLLAALLRAALRRRTGGFAPLLSRLLSSLGPNAPPPRPPDLAQLSILRI